MSPDQLDSLISVDCEQLLREHRSKHLNLKNLQTLFTQELYLGHCVPVHFLYLTSCELLH